MEKSKTVTIEKDALGRNVPAEPEQHLVVENKAEKEDENIKEEKDIQNNVDAVSKTNFNTPSDGDGENNNNNSIRAANGKTTSAEVVNVNTKSDPANSITADKEKGKDVKNENYKPSLRQKAHPSFGNNSSGSEHELHPVAHLNCADHGGPFDPRIIDEMVYWVSYSCLLQNHLLLRNNTHSNFLSFTPTSRIYPPMQTICHLCKH